VVHSKERSETMVLFPPKYSKIPKSISSFSSFRNIVKDLDGWIFRGQGDKDWPLIPKLGRFYYGKQLDEQMVRKLIIAIEINTINDLRLKLPVYGLDIEKGTIPDAPLWNAMFIGQHYGLTTRILDFTENAYIALYFAVNEISNKNSVVWCLKNTTFPRFPQFDITYDFPSNIFSPAPYGILRRVDPISKEEELHRNVIVYPVKYEKRTNAQASVFLLYGDPLRPLIENKNLIKIIIKRSARPKLLKELNDYGINNETLFPDLSGVCKNINWETNLRIITGMIREAIEESEKNLDKIQEKEKKIIE
jgi:hypothetical protein